MHILILSFFYHPEPNDVKAHAIGKMLVHRGHTVTAITTFPNYPDGKIYEGYKQKWRAWEVKDGVRLLRVPLYPDHSRSSVKRVLSYFSFMLTSLILGTILSPRPDVVWVYSPPLPTVLSGYLMSLLKRVPFVMEIQDMWPETLASTGMISNSKALDIIGRLAKFLYHRSAAITVISPGFKRNLIEKNVSTDKIHVMPNWTANEELYIPLAREPELGLEHELIGKFNVICGGNIGPAQGLMTVIDTAEQLLDMSEIQFVFIGDGLELPILKEAVNLRQLTNVKFIDRQPSEMMPSFFAWADALLVHLKDDPLFYITIPSRTLSYIACGRPVICAVPGDGADVIRNAGAGEICQPEDSLALIEAVKKLYNLSSNERDLLGHAARRAYEENYQSQIQIERYETLFQKIVADQQGAHNH